MNPVDRAKSHLDTIKNEKPVFIHPADEDPEDFIAFREEVVFGKDERGKVTIAAIGLDRLGLESKRRFYLNDANRTKRIVELLRRKTDLNDEEREILAENEAALAFYESNKSEYRGMLKCNGFR